MNLPKCFLELKEEQQAGALVALRQVDDEQQQAVLEEWAARCREGQIRKPAGYLFGIIQKAIRGEFKAWAGQNAGMTQNPSGADVTSKPASPEVAQVYLTQLRTVLHGKRPP
jgi:hypothetical protein